MCPDNLLLQPFWQYLSYLFCLNKPESILWLFDWLFKLQWSLLQASHKIHPTEDKNLEVKDAFPRNTEKETHPWSWQRTWFYSTVRSHHMPPQPFAQNMKQQLFLLPLKIHPTISSTVFGKPNSLTPFVCLLVCLFPRLGIHTHPNCVQTDYLSKEKLCRSPSLK